jgi:urease accessory protein
MAAAGGHRAPGLQRLQPVSRCNWRQGPNCLGWDVLALGLPASGEAFDRGSFLQQLELPGVWLERGLIARRRPCCCWTARWAGPATRVLATLWFVSGSAWANDRREALLESARALLGDAQAGVTAVHERVLVLRLLAPHVEAAMRLLQAVRAAWRLAAWGLQGEAPRVWRT